jgi:antitoxin (DNA-binding transcriptional repressor) of toxin-antitoxin stability system
MISANMHEAKSRLSAWVKAVEEDGETVILCRNGKCPCAGDTTETRIQPANGRFCAATCSLRVQKS